MSRPYRKSGHMPWFRSTLKSWLDTDSVVDGSPEVLLASEILLRRLYGDMAKQELNLLPARHRLHNKDAHRIAGDRAAPSQELRVCRHSLCHMPDNFPGDAVAPGRARSTNAAK